MTKKIFLILVLMFAMGTSFAGSTGGGGSLPIHIKPTNPGDLGNQPARGSIVIPEVYLDGNTLSFDSTIEGCTVQLLDEDEAVVYSSVISVGQTTLVLPTTLSGEFELQIVSGDITFYCYIEL